MIEKEILDLGILTYSVAVMVIIAVTIILFFVVFQKRKNQLLKDKVKQQQKFDEELVKTQQEIQEETLKHIGRELHDNVGQRLVLASMQMNSVLSIAKDETKTKVENAAVALKESLEEVRAISKSLNSDVIFNLGFDLTVKNEIERLQNSGLIDTKLTTKGEKINFENRKDEIILFRILQEFFSNTLKYAEAEHLKVCIDYQENQLDIKVEDDGKGCDIETVEKGSGLINMKKRAELLNATFQLDSQLEKGTTLHLQYPYKIV